MSVWGKENTDGHDDDNEDLLDNEDLQALEETIQGPERRGSEVRLRRSKAEDVARYDPIPGRFRPLSCCT